MMNEIKLSTSENTIKMEFQPELSVVRRVLKEKTSEIDGYYIFFEKFIYLDDNLSNVNDQFAHLKA